MTAVAHPAELHPLTRARRGAGTRPSTAEAWFVEPRAWRYDQLNAEALAETAVRLVAEFDPYVRDLAPNFGRRALALGDIEARFSADEALAVRITSLARGELLSVPGAEREQLAAALSCVVRRVVRIDDGEDIPRTRRGVAEQLFSALRNDWSGGLTGRRRMEWADRCLRPIAPDLDFPVL